MTIPALVLGFIKGRFIFAKLARPNLERIGGLSPREDKICLFAFQASESYAVIYPAIGAALLYGSGPRWRGRPV